MLNKAANGFRVLVAPNVPNPHWFTCAHKLREQCYGCMHLRIQLLFTTKYIHLYTTLYIFEKANSAFPSLKSLIVISLICCTLKLTPMPGVVISQWSNVKMKHQTVGVSRPTGLSWLTEPKQKITPRKCTRMYKSFIDSRDRYGRIWGLAC